MEKTYTVVAPLESRGGTPRTVFTVVACRFILAENARVVLFRDANEDTVAIHHLAPGHSITIS